MQFFFAIFGSLTALIILSIIAFVAVRKKHRQHYPGKLEYKKSLLKDTPDIFYHGY